MQHPGIEPLRPQAVIGSNTKHVESVTQTVGYEPIADCILGGPATVTQPVTFSLLHKSRCAGDFVVA